MPLLACSTSSTSCRWMPPLMISPPDKHYLTEFTHLGKHRSTEVSQYAPTTTTPTSSFTMFSNIQNDIRHILYFCPDEYSHKVSLILPSHTCMYVR